MKLRNFRNLSFEDIRFERIQADIRERFCIYYWFLLIIPSIVIYFTTNAAKAVLTIPMVMTAVLIPHAQKVKIQISRIKNCSVVLLSFLVLHSAYQNFLVKFEFDRTLMELIGVLTCLYINNIETVDEEVEEFDDEKKNEVINRAINRLTIVRRLLGIITLVTITGYLKYQPIVISGTLIIESIMANVQVSAKYAKYCNMLTILYILVQVIPNCVDDSKNMPQVIFIAGTLVVLLTISKQVLMNSATDANIGLPDYRVIKDGDKFWKLLKQYPNLNFVLDRFWSLLQPIPLLFCTWSLSTFSGAIEPSILGLTAVFLACSIIIQVHWSILRVIVSKIFKLILTILFIIFMVFEEPSNDRFWKSFLLVLMVTLCTAMEDIYRIFCEKNQNDPLPVMKSFYCPPTTRIYAEVLQRIWSRASPLISMVAISSMTLGTLHSKYRLILLGLAATAGLFARSEVQIFWALIQIYVIVEQSYLLFLSQKTLPSTLNSCEFMAVLANFAILVIAELQRLSHIPSILSPKTVLKMADNIKVGDVDNEDLKSKVSEETTKEVSTSSIIEQESSFIWSSITFLGKFINVSSLLALMASLIFYPQIVIVTFQTCVYSLWACLFTFLFYRSDVMAKHLFIFIGLLAVLSATFFIYNLFLLPPTDLVNFKSLFHVTFGDLSSPGNGFVLHGSVFCYSCASLFTMSISEEETFEASSDEETVKSDENSPKLAGAKFFIEAGSIVERLFVLQWTRSCALLAFLAASFNPSIFGVVHIIIGCTLAWKNILSPRMYVPTILWLLCSTFLPATFFQLFPETFKGYLELLVGEIRSLESTICLTTWALVLFLQPIFMRSLMKLTTENERQNGLVNFQLLPQDESALSTTDNIESFENSSRYYISNWFLEFHNEIMVAVLLVGAVSRKNFYGIIYAVLTLSHVIVPMFGGGLGILARVSFSLQIICYIGEYCLSTLYNHKGLSSFQGTVLQSTKLSLYAKFFGLSSEAPSMIIKSVLVGAYVLLTVRWYLTSVYDQREHPERRFDNHWCRLCNQVSYKSKHAFSKIKHNIHLYLGWASHGFLFMTAISAYHKPTIPAALLLIFSLIFFFYGEASILIPNLRNNVYIVLGIILFWTLADSFMTAWFVFIIGDSASITKSATAIWIYKFSGMTNVMKYININEPENVRRAVFDDAASKTVLGITVFLILLQIRLYSSKAWPFVIARLYHSYATSAKRAQLFNQNLQAAIAFQQRNLQKAAEHVKKQISSMQSLDISDWKKICYVPETDKSEETDDNSAMPTYGEDGLRQRKSINELRYHLDRASSPNNSDIQENEHLEALNSPKESDDLAKPMKLQDRAPLSAESLLPSDQEAKKKLHAMEGNFYWYTLILTLRSIVKYFLSVSHDYRRLLNRPSSRSSLRIIFHHQNYFYRIQFLLQLLFDVINANFDLVLDYLVLNAQIFHSSGFSFLMVIGILLVARMQRPYTRKDMHNRLLIFCAGWILFNFSKATIWEHIYVLRVKGNGHFANIEALRVVSHSTMNRILGIHITGTIANVTLRPTLILLALSYKRSLMRQLGLWDYGRGIRMAKIYHQTEEDLDEIGELNVSQEMETTESSDNYLESVSIHDEEEIFSESESNQEHNEGDEEIDCSIAIDEPPQRSVSSKILNTWKELIWPTITMPWRDFYVLIFVSDFICLFLTMYYWGDMTLGPDRKGESRNSGTTSFFSDMINQNMIPAPLVNVVILSTFILILDRALYVSKSHIGKYLLQIISLVGYHIYIFFYLPQFYTYPNGSNLFGIRLWYFCKWVYWISSALQLKYNYPPLRTETFLGSDYGIVGSTLHNVYRSIPFIEELKTIIDWSVTPSALGLWPWLKYSDIFERLYAVQCARAFQRTYFGRHQFGMPLSQMSKIMQGIMFVGLSVLILWSPFLIMSRASLMSPNTLRSFKMDISLENHGPAFLSFSQEEFDPPLDPEGNEYKALRFKEGVNPFEVDPNYFTKVTLPKVSQAPWAISEGARIKLMEHLSDFGRDAFINVNWTIKREKSQTVPTIKGSNLTERRNLIKVLDRETDNDGVTIAKLSNILPLLIKAPLTETSQLLAKSSSSFEIVKVCPINREPGPISAEELKKRKENIWKKLKMFALTTGGKQVSQCQFFLIESSLKPVSLYIYSTKLPKYNFSSFNLVGLYATVVFTVAQLFRMMHADMTTRIQYDDLPNPEPLLVMCQQILMMRELGDFESEEAIYWQLIEILRNPQILIEMTKT